MIGHIKRQFILPVGTVVELDADSGTLKMKETAFS
jgi:muramoyltetrapeptide carboxypeptidase